MPVVVPLLSLLSREMESYASGLRLILLNSNVIYLHLFAVQICGRDRHANDFPSRFKEQIKIKFCILPNLMVPALDGFALFIVLPSPSRYVCNYKVSKNFNVV